MFTFMPNVLVKQGICNANAVVTASEEEEKPQIGGHGESVVAEEDTALPLEFEAKNGDTSLITDAMEKEEEKLLDARMNEAKVKQEMSRDIDDHELRFSKLDELLTQTQLYSEFLLEKMDDITFVTSTMRFHIAPSFCNGLLRFLLLVLFSTITQRTLLK